MHTECGGKAWIRTHLRYLETEIVKASAAVSLDLQLPCFEQEKFPAS